MNSGLSTTNRAIEKASRVLEGFESDAADHAKELMEDTKTSSPLEGARGLFSNPTQATKMDPMLSKVLLERESRKKMLSEAAGASQQVAFMEWLGQATEDETKDLLEGYGTESLSFYEEVQIMMEIWVQANWLNTSVGKAIARQACTIQTDLPFFSIEDLKKSR